MKRVILPPSTTGQPYSGEPFIVEAFGGENIYVPTLPGVNRYLVTAKESKNQFTILGGAGMAGTIPAPFHYHKYTRHDFLVTRGQLKVWLNDQCRILGPGDYAHVAPGTIHSFQFISDHSEILGIITPVAFENMFRILGETYDGPLWPDVDNRDPREVLASRTKRASEEFDVIPVHGHKVAEATAWSDTDTQLHPGPYFLKNGRGPSAVLGGTVVRPYITGTESDESFTMGTIEGSHSYQTQVLTGGFQFPTIHHVIYVSDGYLLVTADNVTSRVGPLEVVWLPAGTIFDIKVESRYVKAFVYSSSGGLVDLLYQAGKENAHDSAYCMLPENPQPFDRRKLLNFTSQFNFNLL